MELETMLPLLGGLITGGASLLGNLFSSETSAQTSQANTQANIAAQESMQAETEKFNADQAAINRGYQTQMSNTAYQRASADMQAAGLNPAMMFGSGGAASSPSGSTASASSPNMALHNAGSPLSGMSGLGDAVGKVISSAQGIQQLDQQKADIDLKRAQKHDTDEAALNKAVDTVNKGTTNDLIKESVAAKSMDNIIKQVGVTSAKNIQGIDPTARKVLDIGSFAGGKASDAVAPLLSTAKGIKSLLPSRSTSETTHEDGSPGSFTERFQY